MHFCPRPSCQRFYHSSCLTKSKSRDPTDPSLRRLHLLSSSPDSDLSIELENLAPKEPAQKRRRGRPSAASLLTTHLVRKTAEELLGDLPQMLLRIAEQPIVRGAAFSQGGVSGNVRAVIHARRMVYEAIGGGRGVKEGWEEEVGVEEPGGEERAIVKIGTKHRGNSGLLQPWLCPNCWGPI